jgi:hypothetical protein
LLGPKNGWGTKNLLGAALVQALHFAGAKPKWTIQFDKFIVKCASYLLPCRLHSNSNVLKNKTSRGGYDS